MPNDEGDHDDDHDDDDGDDGLLRGVKGTSLSGLYGRPFLKLDALLGNLIGLRDDVLAAVHEEICMALAQVPVDYTGGSHRSMGIMPPSQRDGAVVDYGEVLRSLDDDQWSRFVALADDPTDFVGVSRADIGEERSAPISRRQMLWLKVRHGVYFPWKAYVEMIPNRRWSDKANPEGKRFTRNARQFFPRTLALVEQLPFTAIGRCNVMGLEANDWGTVHRDGDPADQERPDEFITLYPVKNKRLFLWDEEHQQKHVVDDAAAVWFNDFDHHGVEAAPFFRYSVRVDGVFTDAFRTLLSETFA
ncbi:MAG: hypothetical protein Q8O67_11710 [Deltaproteobacteria bacterium]|nr:hypothetical protein [Deltaproteobacteria bacterium]